MFRSKAAIFVALMVVFAITCFAPVMASADSLQNNKNLWRNITIGSALVAGVLTSATTAQAMLALSGSLASVSSSEEMAEHLVQTIPSVIDCDRAIVSLALYAAESSWAYATHGFDDQAAANGGFARQVDAG